MPNSIEYRCPFCKRIAETRCGFVKKHWFCNNLIFRWVKTMKPILIAAICLLCATSVEARTTRIKTRTTIVHRHEHTITAVAPTVAYVPQTSYVAPSAVYAAPVVTGVQVVRPMTGGERRRLRRNGAVVVVP